MSRVSKLKFSAAGIAALAAALTSVSAHAASSGTDGSSTADATRAPASMFSAAGSTSAADLGIACSRPNGVTSRTVHCYTPDQLRAHYGLGSLAGSNDGAGQTIVLVDAYGTPTGAEDLAHFAQTFGGPAPSYEAVYPLGKPDYNNPTGNGSGQSGPSSADGWAGEATLDIEWAYAMAPKAHIVLVGTPPAETQGVQGLPNLMKAIDWAVATYPSGTTFSMSFGTDESAFGSLSAAKSQFARFDQTFQRGLAKKDTFFASSGDNGSIGATRAHRATSTSPDPQVSYPNVSPFVTSVGGTQVQDGWTWDPQQDKPFNADGSRNLAYWNWVSGGKTEATWNESWAGIGTGGGLSRVYARPSFQDGVAGVVGNARGVPDVAWNAAVNGGVLVYHSFFPSIEGAPTWSVYGGTSAASPQVAAVTAIGNQARKAAGKQPIGNLNQAIYSPSFAKAAAFNDIVAQKYGTTPSGEVKDNRMWDTGADGFVTPDAVPGYPSTTGYDLTTGWGSPQEPGFVHELAMQP